MGDKKENRKRNREIFKDCVKRNLGAAFVLLFVFAMNLWVFYLYGMNLEPFFYASLLGGVAYLIFFLLHYRKFCKQAGMRKQLLKNIQAEYHNPVEGLDTDLLCLSDRDYCAMIQELDGQIQELETRFERNQTDMEDYYSTWVHQIKTPIAVMRMLLAEDTKEHRELQAELFRIEQYVEMALVYIRLDSRDNDLVIKEYELDDLIRQTLRKFAPQFIGRKLSMDFQATGSRIVTDQKWFLTILEQILSNAVKYTKSGGVSIWMERGILHVKDTGIGIAAEDLPRIFEKGYTGGNGRQNQKSSGIGLYLCRKAAEKVNIKVTVSSVPGEGTTFSLHLEQ